MAILLPERARANSVIHFKEILVPLLARISIGTWYVDPPTRRALT